MQRLTLHPLREITIKSIRDFIIDNQLTENDTLLLNQSDFDEMAVDYRETYNESIHIPYYLLRVLIKEDYLSKVKVKRVGLIKGDNNRFKNDFDSSQTEQTDDYSDEIIYRCGWCRNIVDYDGYEFEPSIRQYKIDVLEKYASTIVVKPVNGKCCPNGHDKNTTKPLLS